MGFKDKLIHELTALDMREAKSKQHNPYAIAHYLRAADEVIDLIEHGIAPERAFSRVYIPTRGMRTVARHLGLKLDVIKGNWTIL